MLCSRCSRPVRPIVCFDLDGVLGDYHGHLHAFAERYLRTTRLAERLNEYDGVMPHREWFEECGVSVQVFRDIKLAYRQGGMKRTMPIYQGMIEIVGLAQELGAEVWITTTRPYLRLDNVDPDTRFWLDYNEVPFDHLMYDEVKYQTLAQMVDRQRVVAVIDDDFEMYDDAEAVFGVSAPILFKQRYNRGVSRPWFADSTRELRLMIKNKLERWERMNG